MTIGASEGYQSDSLRERIEALIPVLEDEQNYFRGARQADALLRIAPRDPDVVGLAVRARGMAALARHQRDGGDFPPDPTAQNFKEFLTEASTLLARFPATLQNTDELALGRALFRLISGHASGAAQLLSATLKERRDVNKEAALAFAGRVASGWLDSDLITKASEKDAHQPLFGALTEVVLDTPLEDLDPRLSFVVGQNLFDHPTDILREVGADLVEHSYDVAEETSRITDSLYDAAIRAVLVRQAVNGRGSRIAERAGSLSRVAERATGHRDEIVWGRELELLLSQMQMDLTALLWTLVNSPEPEHAPEPHRRLRSSLTRVERWRKRVEADLSELVACLVESEPAQPDAIRRLDELVSAVSSVEQLERMAKVLGHMATGRMAWASDVLERESPHEGLEGLSMRLRLLMQAQLAAGRFAHLRQHAMTLALLPKPGSSGQDVQAESTIFEGALMGSLWLRSFDDAEELVEEAVRAGIVKPFRKLDLMITIAGGRVEDDLATATSVLSLRLLVEKALGQLEVEEEEDLAFRRRLTEPHIDRRQRLRWISRGYYHVLAGDYHAAEKACVMARQTVVGGFSEEWSEAQSRESVEAVIAFARGDLRLVEEILGRQGNLAANTVSRQILRAMAAIEREDIAASRRELGRLYRDRPGDLHAAIAYSTALQMHDEDTRAGKTNDSETPSRKMGATETASTLGAANVLSDLRAAVEREGNGYSAVPSKRAAHYVLVSSASVETQLAIMQWSNYKQAGERIKRARKYLDAAEDMGAAAPAVMGVQIPLDELQRQWSRRRPRLRHFGLAALFAAIGGALWLTRHSPGDAATTSVLAAVSFVAAAVFVLFPWVRKFSFRGVEFETADFTKQPSNLLPQLDRELLTDVMRDQFSEGLQSTLSSMRENVRREDLTSGLRVDEERVRAGAMAGAQAGARDLHENAQNGPPASDA